MIVTSKIYLYIFELGIIGKVLFCITRWCPCFKKLQKWRLTRFAMKLFRLFSSITFHHLFFTSLQSSNFEFFGGKCPSGTTDHTPSPTHFVRMTAGRESQRIQSLRSLALRAASSGGFSWCFKQVSSSVFHFKMYKGKDET